MSAPDLVLLKWTCTGLLAASGFVGAGALVQDPQSLPHRWHLRYVTHLDRQLRDLFWPMRGRWIFIGQLFALELLALAGVWLSEPGVGFGVPVVLLGPHLWLERLRVRRVRALEKQLDGFLLTLANSLRATPSLGSALAQTRRLLDEPMSQELGVALQEMRVGSSVDQALLALGGRVQSSSLESALLAILIGRRIGGDLTRVLETTAATLREMARLRGVLASKTAEAKAQMWILAVVPAVIAFAFDAIKPGYFEPLLASWTGWLILTLAAALWAGSLLLAWRVLAVKL